MKKETIDRVRSHWEDERIFPRSVNEVTLLTICEKLNLPQDCIDFYSQLNGMGRLNETEGDSLGFFFYSLEEIAAANVVIRNTAEESMKDVFVFGDYLQKCWYYGIKVTGESSYNIYIIHSSKEYEIITDSLDSFFNMYLNNSNEIYGW